MEYVIQTDHTGIRVRHAYEADAAIDKLEAQGYEVVEVVYKMAPKKWENPFV